MELRVETMEREKINNSGKRVSELGEVLVFGAGEMGKLVIRLFDMLGIKVIACMDNDANKKGRKVYGNVTCILPVFLGDIPVFISIQKRSIAEEVRVQCTELGYKRFYFYECIEELLNVLPDKECLDVLFEMRMNGQKINWENPRTYNQKLQWLKLHDRNPNYTKMVDKYEVKHYVASIIGEKHIIPTLGVWDSFSEIDFNKLPKSFVLKCTHNSGGIVCVADKEDFDRECARKAIERALKRNYYLTGREWPYKDVVPRIIAEKYMTDESGMALKDYKFFCFHGEPKIILTVEGGHEDESKTIRRMYDVDWKRYPVGLHGKKMEVSDEEKPEQLDEMLQIAKQLSAGIKHVRVDLYLINKEIYFGELTFYHMCGHEIFDPMEYDMIFGSFLYLE